jgi:hypothetical protein
VSDWTVEVPARLNTEIANLAPAERRVVYDALRRIAADPRAGRLEPVAGAELRRVDTEPLPGTAQTVTIMYRIREPEHIIAVIWLLAGP